MVYALAPSLHLSEWRVTLVLDHRGGIGAAEKLVLPAESRIEEIYALMREHVRAGIVQAPGRISAT